MNTDTMIYGKKIIIYIIFLLFMAIVIHFIYYYQSQYPYLAISHIEFDSFTWKAQRVPLDSQRVSDRQKMLKDLITNILPKMKEHDIPEILDENYVTTKMLYDDAISRLKLNGMDNSLKNEYLISLKGKYIDNPEWDYQFVIGSKLLSNFDYFWAYDEEEEILFIKFDSEGNFESWYISGSSIWLKIIGRDGMKTYREIKQPYVTIIF